MKFKTSSFIKSIVGKDLITDPYIAVFELVKNSYDADAHKVIISFNTGEDNEQGFGKINQQGKIYIVDNGHGMSKADLENKWLALADSEKVEGQIDDNKINTHKRVYVGSKGIGRFSTDRLGSLVTIRTKIASENIEHKITIDWEKYEKSSKILFNEIENEYSFSSNLSLPKTKSYTIIEISNLRENWEDENIEKVIEKVRRLKNPFKSNDNLNIYCGINIFNLGEKVELSKNYLIESNISDVLKEKSINITAKISKTPTQTKDNISNKGEVHQEVNITLHDRGELIYEISKREIDSILGNVDKIEISVNYLTTSAKSTFTRRMGIEPVNYGNIFIYRNGFHVSPYGDTNYDIFGLNLRKTQGYSRYLATRELIGFISIDDSKNYFKETSSRNNGFIENGYFTALENFYMDFVQRPLERYVHLINFGEDKELKKELNFSNANISENEKENFKKYISKDGYIVKSFDENLNFEKNKPEKIIERLKAVAENPHAETNNEQIKKDTKKLEKQFKAIKEENKEVTKAFEKTQEKLEYVERQNLNLSRKRSEQSYNEQITHHFVKLSKRLKSAVANLEGLKTNLPEEELDKFNIAIRKIVRTQNELIAFQELLTKTEIETRKNTSLNWIELFTWYFDEKTDEKLKINIIYEKESILKNWLIPNTYAIEVIMLLENLFENAKDNGATYIDFIFESQALKIQNDSRPIPENIINDIFDLGFTTKKSGTGIGLNQVKSFLKKHDMTISVKNLDNLVEFTIQRVK